MITKGQARRISAEWQAPGNECSLLQHKGVISDDLGAELADNLATSEGRVPQNALELRALMAFATRHGSGTVAGWGAWDDTPVERQEA